MNSKMYSCRGNHDNPALFDNIEISKNIILVKDYSVLELEGERVLFLGGATSIDRTARTLGRNYWKKEEFDYRPEIINSLGNIDIVVSHSGPNQLRSNKLWKIIYWLEKDLNLHRDLAVETSYFDSFNESLLSRPKYWFCGHFHPESKRVFENCTNYVQLTEHEMYNLNIERYEKEETDITSI